MFHRSRRPLGALAGLLSLAAILAAPAFADIKAFNAAVKAGDYKTAAAEAETIWKTWDKSSPDTALMAREFGFAALVSGRNDLAQTFGKFLVEQGKSLPTPDDQPATSAVLKAIADFKVSKQGEPERAALREALFARNAAPNADMTTVLSWQALYVADWNRFDWDNVIKDAAGAVDLLKRQPASLLARQREAEVMAAAADFVQGRARQTPQTRSAVYEAMANLHDVIVGDLNAATSAGLRSQLWAVKWKAEAWTGAVESYMNSSYTQIGSVISTAIKPRALAQPNFAQIAEDAGVAAVPVCDGKFEGRTIKYPENRALEGLVGSVIARIETDADGKVVKSEVLSAVPLDGFGDRVVETVKDWRYKAKNTSGCRLNSRNHIFHVQFVIGR
jgi:TonB family protein